MSIRTSIHTENLSRRKFYLCWSFNGWWRTAAKCCKIFCEPMQNTANSYERLQTPANWFEHFEHLLSACWCYNAARCNVPFRDRKFHWHVQAHLLRSTSDFCLQDFGDITRLAKVWKPQQGFLPASLLLSHPHAIPVDHSYWAFRPPAAPPPHRGHEHQALRSQHILRGKSSWRAESGGGVVLSMTENWGKA